MKKPAFLMFAVYISFLALGMPDGAFGVAWPGMRYEMGLPLERAAWLIISHSVFYSLAGSQTGRLAKRFRLGQITGFGFVFLALGILCLSLATNIFWLVGATAILGIGMGLVDSCINAFAAMKFSAKHMNWLHCFWGMGGAISPLIMRQMIYFYDWRMGYRTIFAIQAAIGIILAVSILRGLWTEEPESAPAKEAASGGGVFLRSRAYIFLQQVVFFLYTAFEYSITFWTVSVLIEGRGVAFETAAFFPAVYLGSLMAGRFVFGYVTAQVSGSHIIRFGLSLAATGLLILAFSNNIVGIALVGFGFAPVFPCLMNETKFRFDPHILSKLVGFQIAAVGGGVMLSAIVMGRLLERVSYEALFIVSIFGVLTILMLNEVIHFALKRAHR